MKDNPLFSQMMGMKEPQSVSLRSVRKKAIKFLLPRLLLQELSKKATETLRSVTKTKKSSLRTDLILLSSFGWSGNKTERLTTSLSCRVQDFLWSTPLKRLKPVTINSERLSCLTRQVFQHRRLVSSLIPISHWRHTKRSEVSSLLF